MLPINQTSAHNLLPQQYQVARRIGILSILATVLGVALYFFLAILQRDWRYWILLIDTLILLSGAIAFLFLVERKRIEAGLWVFIPIASITFAAPTFLFTNMALLQGPSLVILTALLVLQIFPRERSPLKFFLLAFVSGTTNLLLDIFLPLERPLAPSFVIISLSGIFLFAIASYAIGVRSQFPDLPLRAKVTIFFVIVSMLAVTFVSSIHIITTRDFLLSVAQNNLQVAANNLANGIDNWISSTLTSIRAEAQTPLFYKSLSSSKTSEDISQDTLKALIALRNKNPIFIEAYSLFDISGTILLSTDAGIIGANQAERDYFRLAIEQGLPVLTIWYGENRIYVSSPVRDPDNNIVGVLNARYTASILQQFMSQSVGLGGTASFPILIDNYNIIIAEGRHPNIIFKSLVPIDPQTLRLWQDEGRFPKGNAPSFSLELDEFSRQITDGNTILAQDAYGVEQQGVVVSLKQQPWKLIFVQPRLILIQPINREIQQTFLISAGVILLAAYAAFNLSKIITAPLGHLTEVALQIASGQIEQQVEVTSHDETGQLSRAFNTMTAQLRDLINSLEQRVAERTRNIERRALLLQTAAEVGQTALQTRDIESLLNQITHLISQRFGFYHVGIFLLDERREYAVLRAANSEGGQRMLARGHKLGVGQTGIVGYVTAQGKARIALDVGADAVYFDNPDLPQTRSEMALPLIAGNTILGALDVQSTEPAAFQEEDIATLQVMTNQIAIAIENARLFAENQAALEATRRAYGEISRKAWQDWLQENVNFAYLASPNDILLPLSTPQQEPEFLQAMQQLRPVLTANRQIVFVPIQTRGQAIGGLRLVKAGNEIWTEDEIHLVETVVNQLSAALENARLFLETARRAERERTVSQITTNIRATTDADKMIQTALEELKRVLGAAEVSVRPYSESIAVEQPRRGRKSTRSEP